LVRRDGPDFSFELEGEEGERFRMDEKARADILKQKKECLRSSSSARKKGKGRSVFKLTSNHLLLSFPLLPSFFPNRQTKR